MNIYLLPYTWARHLVMAWFTAGAAAVAWWVCLWTIVALGPVAWRAGVYWPQSWEGGLYLAAVSAAVAGATLFGEGALRRRALAWRWLYVALAAGSAWLGTITLAFLLSYLVPLLAGSGMAEVVADGSLVTLRYRVALWAAAGLSSGVSPWLVRLLHRFVANRFARGVDVGWRKRPLGVVEFLLGLFHHLGAGVAGGLLGAAAWHAMGFYEQLAGDLYLASLAGPVVWGFTHGLLCWAVPDDLYAGWVRVLSHERYGLRIPLDASGATVERFTGHFPRGLDLYLPGERGVAELQASFLASEDQRYSVRGLSVAPTVVRRFLERIDLRYDPRRPAPFETELRMEDRVVLGERGEAEVEFLLLPREEQ